jgi:hypothetical protein
LRLHKDGKLPQGEAWDRLVSEYRMTSVVSNNVNDVYLAKKYGYKNVDSFTRAMRKRGIKRQSVFRMHDVEQPEIKYVAYPEIKLVPFPLGTNIIYRADFVTFARVATHPKLLLVTVYEVKGMETPEWKLKHKLFKAKYPLLTLEII